MGAAGSTFLQFTSRVRVDSDTLSCANFDAWPDVDGKTCGNCQALVLTKNFNRCDRYCESFGHRCVAAAEEKDESCEVEEEKACDEAITGTSDMLCTCQITGEDCYGSLNGVASIEGASVGVEYTASLEECRTACSGKANCKSFALCPQWNRCFLKDRSLTGNEAVRVNGNCKTYFKTACGTTSTTTTTTTTTVATTTMAGGLCYASLDGVASVEGQGLGMVETTELEKCEKACEQREGCRSFARCPQWGRCFLKDRSFTGGESSRTNGDCKTFYQISCSLTTTTTTTTRDPESGNMVKVVSYNLYWWNAFQKNSWKSDGIIDNIKSTLRPDALGLQECDSPSEVRSRSDGAVEKASEFQGAQGVMVKPNIFSTSNSGSRDLDATGKWGPRYVTWVQLTNTSGGRPFWHFNTHWCVHSEGDRVCNEDVRYRGAQNMLKTIQENAGDEPVVITGDFNANMNEKGIRHFLDNGFKLAVNSWVDAIIYSEHWDLLDKGIGEMAGSDHRPVWAELWLRSNC